MVMDSRNLFYKENYWIFWIKIIGYKWLKRAFLRMIWRAELNNEHSSKLHYFKSNL